MSRPWLRLYHEWVSDPKVQLLAFEDQRHFIALLCLKCAGTLDSKSPSTEYRERMVARALGLSPDAALEAKRRLVEVGLVTFDWQPVKWDSRQYESDLSTDRVREWRAKQRETLHETLPQQCETVSGTDENRTEQNRTEKARGSRRVPTEFVPDLDYARKQLPDIDAEAESQKFRDWEFKTPRKDWPAAWRTWIHNCRDRGHYAKKKTGEWH